MQVKLQKASLIHKYADFATKDLMATEFVHLMETEGHDELTMVFGNCIIHGTRQMSGDIDLVVGDVTHAASLITKSSDRVEY